MGVKKELLGDGCLTRKCSFPPLWFFSCVYVHVCVRTHACLPLDGYGSTSVHACMWQAICWSESFSVPLCGVLWGRVSQLNPKLTNPVWRLSLPQGSLAHPSKLPYPSSIRVHSRDLIFGPNPCCLHSKHLPYWAIYILQPTCHLPTPFVLFSLLGTAPLITGWGLHARSEWPHCERGRGL